MVAVDAGGQTVRSSGRCSAWSAELGEPGGALSLPLAGAATCELYADQNTRIFRWLSNMLCICLAVPGLELQHMGSLVSV